MFFIIVFEALARVWMHYSSVFGNTLYACPCFLTENALYLLVPVRKWADGECPLTPLAYIGSHLAWIWRGGGVAKQPLHHVHLLESVPDIPPCGFHCIQSIVMLEKKKEEELALMHYAWV